MLRTARDEPSSGASLFVLVSVKDVGNAFLVDHCGSYNGSQSSRDAEHTQGEGGENHTCELLSGFGDFLVLTDLIVSPKPSAL